MSRCVTSVASRESCKPLADSGPASDRHPDMQAFDELSITCTNVLPDRDLDWQVPVGAHRASLGKSCPKDHFDEELSERFPDEISLSHIEMLALSDEAYVRPKLTAAQASKIKASFRANCASLCPGRSGMVLGWRESTRDFYSAIYHNSDIEDVDNCDSTQWIHGESTVILAESEGVAFECHNSRVCPSAPIHTCAVERLSAGNLVAHASTQKDASTQSDNLQRKPFFRRTKWLTTKINIKIMTKMFNKDSFLFRRPKKTQGN